MRKGIVLAGGTGVRPGEPLAWATLPVCTFRGDGRTCSLAEALPQMAKNLPLRDRLAGEALQRPLKSWQEYADDIVLALDEA